MKITREVHRTATVITVQGELVADACDAFRRSCRDHLDVPRPDVVLDLEGVTLIDSAGLEALLWLADEIADERGRLRLARPTEEILRVLSLTRIERYFDVHDTIESAARSFRGR